MQLWNWDHNKLNSFLDERFFLILWKVPIFEVIKKNFFVRKILPPRYFPLFFCHINWRNFALLKTQTVLAVTLWNIKLFYVYVLRFQSQIVIAQRNLGQCTHLGLGWRRVNHFREAQRNDVIIFFSTKRLLQEWNLVDDIVNGHSFVYWQSSTPKVYQNDLFEEIYTFCVSTVSSSSLKGHVE